MRLIELDPRWLLNDAGERIGFSFRSPTRSDYRQTCFVAPTPRRTQFEAFWRELGLQNASEDERDRAVTRPNTFQPCKPEAKWEIAGGIAAASFDTLSVTPSLDGSAAGNWHGHITNGEIVGGLNG